MPDVRHGLQVGNDGSIAFEDDGAPTLPRRARDAHDLAPTVLARHCGEFFKIEVKRHALDGGVDLDLTAQGVGDLDGGGPGAYGKGGRDKQQATANSPPKKV